MNSKTKAAGIAILATLITLPVFAETTGVGVDAGAGVTVGGARVQATVDAKIEARITKGKGRADQEIDRRITALNELNTRVQGMAKVSASMKTSVANEVSGEVSTLTTLKAKIDADTDIGTLKTDIKSITADYRIFILIIPQVRITVAADKIVTVADSMATLEGKLATRISAAQTAGKDITQLTTWDTDMKAKIADANVQASAAVSAVVGLVPDNGDKTKMAANTAALKTARAAIKAAMVDLQTARQDAHSIVQGLHGMGLGASASASSTTSGRQ